MLLNGFDPARYDDLLTAKSAAVGALLQPLGAPPPEIFSSPPTAFRMRAEFRMWHDGDALDYVMFPDGDSRSPVPVRDFPIACEPIQALMPALRDRLQSSPALRRKLFQAEFMATLHGEVLVTLAYHRKLESDWEAAAGALRNDLQSEFGPLSLIGRSRKQKIVLGREYVTEELPVGDRRLRYRQYEQGFTQPNAHVNIRMIDWACSQAAGSTGDLLELYCGNGNFTLPLAAHFPHVIATEVSKLSVRAARANLADNGVDNVCLVRLSAEETAAALAGVREFRRLADLPRPLAQFDLRTLFVDPPRAGLDDHTRRLAGAFERIIYLSCNPATLARDAAALADSHHIAHFALFDQFPYTEHMECGIVLQRRAAGPG